MAKVNVDPEELRRFAKELNRFNEELEKLFGGLKAKMNNLEKNWTDQEQVKFSAEFDMTIKSLGRFLELSDSHTKTLMKKAHHVEEYLRQR